MQTVTLGRTGITVNKNGFGALPIQRVGADYAGKLLRKAYEAGLLTQIFFYQPAWHYRYQ